eukprot:SAG11_NODE_768_length_7269_cov_3.840725_7_plen_210_part_00
MDDPATQRIIVPRQPTALWQTRPLLLNRFNVELRLEPRVVLQAQRGFSMAAARHFCTYLTRTSQYQARARLCGCGAWITAMQNSTPRPNGGHASIEVFDSHNVSTSGVSIAETGGDGILLDGCTGCTVRNVTTEGAYRNGLSVISAKDLLVEGFLFSQTGAKGTVNGGEWLTTKNGSTALGARVEVRTTTNVTHAIVFLEKALPFVTNL